MDIHVSNLPSLMPDHFAVAVECRIARLRIRANTERYIMFWQKPKNPLPTAYASAPPPHPRWMPVPNALSFTQRIDFDPGAPAWTYNQYGPLEYPVVAGYSPRDQFDVFQSPVQIDGQQILRQGLGQSWTMQPPSPAGSTLYTQTQLAQMTAVALSDNTPYYG